MNSTSIGWKVQGLTGIALLLMAVAAARVDVINNTTYGATISTEIAIVLGLAAGCVVALPTAAAILKWNWHLLITTLLCVALTMWCGHKAYTSKQDSILLGGLAGQESYETAKKNEADARAALARITELGDTASLVTMLSLATEDRTLKCDGRHKRDVCQDAKDAEKAVVSRLSDAKARDGARAVLAQAGASKKEGPKRFASDSVEDERFEARIMTKAAIVVTQLIALLGGTGVRLIGGAWIAMPRRQAPKRSEARPLGGPTGGTKMPIPAMHDSRPVQSTKLEAITVEMPNNNVTKFHREAVRTAFQRYTVPSSNGVVRGYHCGQIFQRAFKQEIGSPDLREILKEVFPGKVRDAANGGWSLTGVELRTAKTAAQARPVALVK